MGRRPIKCAVFNGAYLALPIKEKQGARSAFPLLGVTVLLPAVLIVPVLPIQRTAAP